jgi:hypothetical protein
MKHLVLKLAMLLPIAALAMEPQPAAVPAVRAPTFGPPPAAAAPAANTPSAPTPVADALEPAVQTSPGAAAPRAQDRLELDTTQITGNRELPRVLYVVPWKRPDLGDLGGKPANSLLDEVLAPVDRDVFRRQNRYYEALKPDAVRMGGAGGTEGEK